MKFDGENPILDSLFSDNSFQVNEAFSEDVTLPATKVNDDIHFSSLSGSFPATSTQAPSTQSTQLLPFLIELVFTEQAGPSGPAEKVQDVSDNFTSSLANLNEEKSFVNLPTFVTNILENTGVPLTG